MLPECLEEANLQCLYYQPLTAILGRAFEQIGQAEGKPVFVLIGRMIPYLGIRWQQSNKARSEG